MKYLLLKKYFIFKALAALSVKVKLYLFMFAIGIGASIKNAENPLCVELIERDATNGFSVEVVCDKPVDLNIKIVDWGNNKVLEESTKDTKAYKKEFDLSQLDKGEYKVLVSNNEQIVMKSVLLE